MNAVESVRLAQEVSRCFAGAADPAELSDSLRLDAVFIKCLDDLGSNGVVAASCAESRFGAFVIGHGETQPVHMLRCGGRLVCRR